MKNNKNEEKEIKKLNKSATSYEILTILLVFLVIIVCAESISRRATLNRLRNNQVESTKEVTAAEKLFGKYYQSNNYVNDDENLLYSLNQLRFDNDGDVEVDTIYNIKELNNKLKDYDDEKFIGLLKTSKYNIDKYAQNPEKILDNKEGNCSAYTLLIYNWLKLHKNPSEYKYYMKINTSESNIEGIEEHMYLNIKPEGENSIIIDISDDETKDYSIKEFEDLLKRL